MVLVIPTSLKVLLASFFRFVFYFVDFCKSAFRFALGLPQSSHLKENFGRRFVVATILISISLPVQSELLHQGSASLVRRIRAIPAISMEKENGVPLVPAIEDFGEIYESLEERKDWEMFMLHIQTTCEQLMLGKVETSVTSRVKSWDSLRKKLTIRHRTQQYSDSNAILNGLAENDHKLDIIGARIRAFFPKQLKTVREIIEEFFTVVERKSFESDYKNKDELPAISEKFGNYEGIHYWVRFKRNDTDRPLDPRLWKRFKNHAFEIQFRSSMLLDGWAEVRHVITYKALGGFPKPFGTRATGHYERSR